MSLTTGDSMGSTEVYVGDNLGTVGNGKPMQEKSDVANAKHHGNAGCLIASDNLGTVGNSEPMQEKDHVANAKHHGNVGCLIAATSNEASREPSGGAPDGAEAARPDRCLQVQNDASIFLHWISIDPLTC
jgi:hypothetical protein